MNKIITYAAEKDIEDIIQQQTSIAYIAPLTKSIVSEDSKDKLSKILSEYNMVNASIHDNDLYTTQSILVSTSWNKNDDVFGKEQVWPARHTPAHKPTNLNHEEQLIVGHMTDDIYAVDNDGQILADNLDIADLPDLFHIVNSAVIYKCWSDEALQKRTAKLIEQIENNQKYVSMECLFYDFDYAIMTQDNKQYVIARGEETAWMTKHLRAYGGGGIYNDYKVGRYLKNITFVGKGYVDRPANPDSIIFDKNSMPFAKSSEENHVLEDNGVSIIIAAHTNDAVSNNAKENKTMADNAQVEALQATIVELRKQIAEADTKKLEAKIEELTSDINSIQAELVSANEEKNTTIAELKELQSKFDEKSKAYNELQTKIDEMEAAKIVANRISMLVDGGIQKDAASEKVELFNNLTDEQFATLAIELIEAKKSYKKTEEKAKEEKEEKEETSVAEEATEEEVDDADASATEETLESAEAHNKVDITGGSTNTNDSNELRTSLVAAISSIFGIKQEKETE